jgi:hypothetical protein
MNKTTAAAAAGAVALAATSAVSALLLTLGQPMGPALAAEPVESVVTEYVDQYGNPVAAPTATGQLDLPRFVVVDAAGAAPEVIEEIEYVTTYAPAPVVTPTYEDDEHDNEEYEHDDDEDEEYDDD